MYGHLKALRLTNRVCGRGSVCLSHVALGDCIIHDKMNMVSCVYIVMSGPYCTQMFLINPRRAHAQRGLLTFIALGLCVRVSVFLLYTRRGFGTSVLFIDPRRVNAARVTV